MILSPFRRIWKAARAIGFVSGYAAGLADGLVETVSEHTNVALLPDDVCEAFWKAHDAACGDDIKALRKADEQLYFVLRKHMIPEGEAAS